MNGGQTDLWPPPVCGAPGPEETSQTPPLLCAVRLVVTRQNHIRARQDLIATKIALRRASDITKDIQRNARLQPGREMAKEHKLQMAVKGRSE